jgi:peptide deformylase
MKLVDSNNSILHTKTEPLSIVDICSLEKLAYDMLEFMEQNKAVGLAAPQIGLNHRLFVMNINKKPRIVFNPEILKHSDKEQLYEEGCLSFPGLFMKVKRPKWVAVRYKTIIDEQVVNVTESLNDIDCQCFCHELDHLNGITFDKRVSRTKFKQAVKKRNKTGDMNGKL